MSEWTLEQWVGAMVIWLWGTWISYKISGGLQRNFESRVLAIHPNFKLPDSYYVMPSWAVGAVCAWLLSPVIINDKARFVYFLEWAFYVVVGCLVAMVPVLILSHLGWSVFNRFSNFKMYYHAAVLSAKSLDQSQQSK